VKNLVIAALLALPAANLLAAEPAAPRNEVVRMEGRQFGFVALHVADMDKALSFYRALGLVERFHHDLPATFEVAVDFPEVTQAPHLLLVVQKAHQGAYPPGGSFRSFTLYVKDIEQVCRQAAAAGGKLATAPVDNAQFKVKIAYLQDPDGNAVQLLENY
jgi:predicted enzyme related to lactoylglutathione lyase